MCNSSFVVARAMPFFIHTNQCFNCLTTITKIQYFFDQIAHISAYDKARTSHESSLKISDSAFSDGLNSFQNCLMLAPVTVQSSPCPPCNSFSRIFQNLVNAVLEKNTIQSEINENYLVRSFKRCDNKIDDWISFVSEHKNKVNDFKAVISERSDQIYDLVQIDTARIFGDQSDEEAALEYIKHYEHDLRDACRLKRFDVFKMLVDKYLNESFEHYEVNGGTNLRRLTIVKLN